MKWSAQRRRVSHMAQDGALSRAMDGEGQLSLLFSLIRGPGVNQRSSAHTCYYRMSQLRRKSNECDAGH